MNSLCYRSRQQTTKRGMLLILVLCMLTLFLIMGATGLVLATRARESALAFSAATSSRSAVSTLARQLLDEALLKLVRGPSMPTKVSESLLEDKYATALTGTLVSITPQANTPLLRATVSGITTTVPMAMNGRVISFAPRGNDPAIPLSYRILRAEDPGIFWLINERPTTPTPMPAAGCEVVINGREFLNEPWDAFDAENPFLTYMEPNTNGDVTLRRPAFGALSQPAEVDNDNDGVADGIWLTGTTNFFPPVAANGGGEIKCSVSYLVLDLDGRINVNAHGAPPNSTQAGLGPADIDASAIFTPAVWNLLMSGGTPLGTGTTPSATNWRPAPALGIAVEGRYGPASNMPNNLDPYRQRLDIDAPRPMEYAGNGGANVYTYGELERILRSFDADAATLPARLAALLDTSAQRARMAATSDSWDTPGMTGNAMIKTGTLSTLDSLAPEVAVGLRFNLNRKWNGNSANDRKAFFEDFYHSLIAAGVPATQTTAQWVANVVAFRDNDASQSHQYQIPNVGTVQGVEPPTSQSGAGILGNWNRGEFVSTSELLAIPSVTQQQLQDHIDTETLPLMTSLAASLPVILEAVHVPSRFASSAISVPPQSVQAVGLNDLLDNQLSRWREPGRVNANTCSQQVWNAASGESGGNPFLTQPAKTPRDILTTVFTNTNCIPMATTVRDRANRLGSVATIRSNVFAVWITLKLENSSAGGTPPSYHRLFAIVDRSIPVAYRPGETLNVRDAIRLQRFLE